MSNCIACERPNAHPSTALHAMCARCWSYLPEVTRRLYLSGGLRRDRIVAITKERTASCRVFGGGKR